MGFGLRNTNPKTQANPGNPGKPKVLRDGLTD